MLLAVVALVGVRNHIERDQSSWEGATFGMFATYDNHVSRVVVVTVTDADGPVRVALPDDLQKRGLLLRIAPSQGDIDGLARSVADRVRDDGATRVRVELWRIALQGGDALRLRLEPALTATVEP